MHRLLLSAIALGALALPPAPQERSSEESAQKADLKRRMKEAAAVKDRHMKSLFRLPAVVGAGISHSKETPREPVIQVYVSRELTGDEQKKFPKELEGVRVEVVQTGPFRALDVEPKKKKTTTEDASKEPSP